MPIVFIVVYVLACIADAEIMMMGSAFKTNDLIVEFVLMIVVTVISFMIAMFSCVTLGLMIIRSNNFINEVNKQSKK